MSFRQLAKVLCISFSASSSRLCLIYILSMDFFFGNDGRIILFLPLTTCFKDSNLPTFFGLLVTGMLSLAVGTLMATFTTGNDVLAAVNLDLASNIPFIFNVYTKANSSSILSSGRSSFEIYSTLLPPPLTWSVTLILSVFTGIDWEFEIGPEFGFRIGVVRPAIFVRGRCDLRLTCPCMDWYPIWFKLRIDYVCLWNADASY